MSPVPDIYRFVRFSRWTPYLVLAGVGALVVVGALLFAYPDRFQSPSGGVALGPARTHSPSPSDFIARLAVAASSAAAGDSISEQAVAGPSNQTTPEQRLFDLTNQARNDAGLEPLSFDPDALPVARARAAEQATTAGLSHYDTLGGLAFVGLLDQAGIDYSLAGENLARCLTSPDDIIEVLQQALMNSPSHRANILEPRFTSVAIGDATPDDGGIVFAEIFIAGS